MLSETKHLPKPGGFFPFDKLRVRMMHYYNLLSPCQGGWTLIDRTHAFPLEKGVAETFMNF